MNENNILERIVLAPRKLQKPLYSALEAVLNGEPDALLMTQAQAARAMNCSRFTVRRLVADGVLHPVSIRGLLRYRVAELKSLAEHGAKGGA